MSLREECFITPLSYTAHIPARHPAAKPYHMAPAFHVKVLVHNTHTHIQSPGSFKPWVLFGRCEMLVPVGAPRPRCCGCLQVEVATVLQRVLICCELAGAFWGERRGVYKRTWEDVVFFMSELPGQRRCVVCLCIKYVLGSWARQ